MEECTELLMKWREMACRIWNEAFWPNEDLRNGDMFRVGDYAAVFDEAMARLYEGMVLLRLGYEGRVADVNDPGLGGPVRIRVVSGEVEWLQDPNEPGDGWHAWRRTSVPLHSEDCELEFLGFFDWARLERREWDLVKVRVRRLEGWPEAEGKNGLIPVSAVTAWAVVGARRGA